MRQSEIETFNVCPYQYDLKYRQGINTVKDQSANNALYLGTAIHLGAETRDIRAAIKNYYSNYYAISEKHIEEAMKLEYWLKKLIPMLPDDAIHELNWKCEDWTGTADMLVKNENGTYDLYDFKYSNNIESYKKKPQLHIYAHFLTRLGYPIERMFYVFIPKTFIRRRKTEGDYQFRRRMFSELEKLRIGVIEMTLDTNALEHAFRTKQMIHASKQFDKKKSRLCEWCEYQKYCERGIDYMLIPPNVRREKKRNTKPSMWLYGQSYSGKTSFVDTFDNVLMINTDGNINNVTSPVFRVRDTVTRDGRLTKRTRAWENFLQLVEELEKEQTTYETIVIDLVEDLFEHCRLYEYEKLDISHESDAGFGKGWDIVSTEFLSTIKRVKNLGMQMILLSKEKSIEVKERTGSMTKYAPNIRDSIANVLAGTVDLTARVVADGDDRYMYLKNDPYVFGGGRDKFSVDRVPLNKEAFQKLTGGNQQ